MLEVERLHMPTENQQTNKKMLPCIKFGNWPEIFGNVFGLGKAFRLSSAKYSAPVWQERQQKNLKTYFQIRKLDERIFIGLVTS